MLDATYTSLVAILHAPPAGLAGILHYTDQQSFCRWNFTPSPGWTKEEANILKLCLMKYGVGRWVQILETGLLPGKMIQQLNGQTQRLLGQQSLAGVRLLARPRPIYIQEFTQRSMRWCQGQEGVWRSLHTCCLAHTGR